MPPRIRHDGYARRLHSSGSEEGVYVLVAAAYLPTYLPTYRPAALESHPISIHVAATVVGCKTDDA